MTAKKKKRAEPIKPKVLRVKHIMAACFVTVDEGNLEYVLDDGDRVIHTDMKGGFVRVCLPASVPDETVTRVVERCRKAGALVVRVLPRAQLPVVLPKEEDPVANARQAVEQLVSAAREGVRGPLAEFAEKVMSEEGL